MSNCLLHSSRVTNFHLKERKKQTNKAFEGRKKERKDCKIRKKKKRVRRYLERKKKERKIDEVLKKKERRKERKKRG